MHAIDQRLAELNIQLPQAPKPVASYVPAVRSGKWLIVSGQLPFLNGQLLATGKVGAEVTPELAAQAARQCILNALAVIKAELGGDWSQFSRVVRLGAFVASDNNFTTQPKVANGASDLLAEIFGDAGKHARSAVGVNVLPLNAAVEIELMVELK